MILSSFLSKSEQRVRITPAIEEAICQFAGTDKFSKALPALEAAVKLTTELHQDIKNGCQFYEKDTNGEVYSVGFVFDAAEDTGAATERVRITKELKNDIITMAESLGCDSGDGNEEAKFAKVRPYIITAINVATMLRDSINNGSKFLLVDANGEKSQVRFF